MNITFLERYTLLNKICPGLKLGYGTSQALDMPYISDKETSITHLLDSTFISFSDLEQARVYFSESTSFSVNSIYDDKAS